MLALLLVAVVCADEDLPSSLNLNIPLLHSYDGINWSERGLISILTQGDKRRKSSVKVKNDKFSKEQLNKEGLYYIGVRANGKEGELIQTAILSCNLIASSLMDDLVIYLDSDSGSVLSLNYKAAYNTCLYATNALKPATTAEIGTARETLRPVFAMKKPVTEEVEQQSFFRKYWWVFLIGFFLMMSGGQQPQQGQGQGSR